MACKQPSRQCGYDVCICRYHSRLVECNGTTYHGDISYGTPVSFSGYDRYTCNTIAIKSLEMWWLGCVYCALAYPIAEFNCELFVIIFCHCLIITFTSNTLAGPVLLYQLPIKANSCMQLSATLYFVRNWKEYVMDYPVANCWRVSLSHMLDSLRHGMFLKE